MSNTATKYKTALLHLGFRPFFLGAGAAAILLILAWTLIYQLSLQLNLNGLPPSYWHAHEMVFGYAMAIIAGFILTAAKNWTNIQTLHGYKLLALFLLWAAGRLIPFAGGMVPALAMAISDTLFGLILLAHISILIIRTGQHRQFIILLMLLFIMISNTVFYTGVVRSDPVLMSRGIYTGFYLILTMIIVMGGRVIPFFIERGAGYPVELKKRNWLDVSCIALFVVFWVLEVFTSYYHAGTAIAGILFVLHGWRMFGWHTAAIWKKPLLWVLYIAYGMLVAGFLLRIAADIFSLSPFLAVHAFGYGCVGVVTLGMMCRIIWGHTGREIASPPRGLPLVFIPLITGAIVRSIIPAFFPTQYLFWVGISQGLWIFSFTAFLYIYVPILIAPRADGQYG